MALLNFPLNPSPGDTHVVGSITYTWNGTAWLKTNLGNINAGTVTATTVIIASGSSTVQISSGTIVINGSEVLTTASIFNALDTILTPGTDIELLSNTTTNEITISNVSTLQTVTDRGNTTTNVVHFSNTSASTNTVTGAVVIDGGVGIGGDAWVYGRINSESLKIADSIFDSTLVQINSTSTATIDTYSITQFRSAKYLIQVDEGSGPGAEFQVGEMILLVDNTGTVHTVEYGMVSSNGFMGEFAGGTVGSTVNLYFTPYFPTEKVIKVLRTGMTV
jgi:hypothetical protein